MKGRAFQAWVTDSENAQSLEIMSCVRNSKEVSVIELKNGGGVQ